MMWWRKSKQPTAESLEGLVLAAIIEGMHELADDAPDLVNPIWQAMEDCIEVRLKRIGGMVSDSSISRGDHALVLGYAPLRARPRGFELVPWAGDLMSELQRVFSPAPRAIIARIGLSQGRLLVGRSDDLLEVLGLPVNEALAASYADSDAAIRASAPCFPHAIPAEVRREREHLVW